VPNVAVFAEQAGSLTELLTTAPPDEHQQKDLDYLLTLGELFTLIPYGQLILEQAELVGLADDTLDQIFDVFVRDFSAYAIELHGKISATDAQQDWALRAVTSPAADAERFDAAVAKVRALAGAYEMNP
jgi:acyl-CoA dehydrogenase